MKGYIPGLDPVTPPATDAYRDGWERTFAVCTCGPPVIQAEDATQIVEVFDACQKHGRPAEARVTFR